MVQTIIIGSSMKFRSPRLSILVAALDDLPDPDVDILAVPARVRLRGLTPAPSNA